MRMQIRKHNHHRLMTLRPEPCVQYPLHLRRRAPGPSAEIDKRVFRDFGWAAEDAVEGGGDEGGGGGGLDVGNAEGPGEG